ncbi:MAG: DoxX family protein [Candidatus Methylomirabilaceae bacterium]
MTTPIVMLVLMMAPYAVARIVSAVTSRYVDVRRAAATGLSLLFIFTGIGHFIESEPMSQMLPPWVPERVLLVYLTGVLELVIAAGFLARGSTQLTGWIAVTILVVFFPANIYAAINHLPMGSHASGPVYLLIRAPLQLIILLWVYWFTIKRPGTALPEDASR